MRLLGITLAGLALFAWPLLGLGVPGSAAAFALSLGCVATLVAVEVLGRRMDTRLLAVIAAIAALDSVLRLLLVTGVGGFSPIFLLILCCGYALGAQAGYLCGAITMLVSALVTAGVGPWLPYEMMATGWVGMAAGLVGLARPAGRVRRRDLIVLATTGVVAGFAYGAVMDVWDWTFFRGAPGIGYLPGMPPGAAALRFAHFYLATSLVYDSFRAAGNAILVLLVAAPVLGALLRLRRRYTVEVVAAPAEPSAGCAVG